MDASDIIRRIQAKAIFSVQKQVTTSTQPTCNLSTCCGTTGCIINYPNYQYMYNFKEGQKLCNISTCSTNYPYYNVNDVCQNYV